MLRKTFSSCIVPVARAFHSAKLIRDHNRFGIIGVPFAKGQRKSGVDLGPKYIRAGGLISHLKEIAGSAWVLNMSYLVIDSRTPCRLCGCP